MDWTILRYFTLVTAVIEGGLFSGCILGWSSLAFILKSEGFFRSGCNDTTSNANLQDDAIECESQAMEMNQIYTVSAVCVNLATLLFGYLMDRYGTWVSRTLACVCVTTGSALMTLATPESSIYIYVGMCIYAPGGIGFLVTNMQIGNLFPSTRAIVITIINGLFGSSSFIFLIFKWLYEDGVSLKTVFTVYTFLSLFCFIRTYLTMPKGIVPFDIPTGYKLGVLEWRKAPEPKTSDSDEKTPFNAEDNKPADRLSFTKIALTSLFLLSVFAFLFELVRFNYYLSSFNGFITDLANRTIPNSTLQKEAVSDYTNYLGSIQLLETFVFGPIVGFVVDGSQYLLRRANPHLCDEKGDKIIRLKANVYSTAIASTLGVLSCILQCIESMELQIATIFVVCQYRAFLMGSTANFLNLAFPDYHFGKLYGITRTVGGIGTMAAVPIYNYVYGIGKKFEYANYGFAIAIGLTYIHVINVWRVSRKRIQMREAELGNPAWVMIPQHDEK